VLQQAYTWIRGHPLMADGLLGLVLLAGSADQLKISPDAAAVAAATVNVLFALAVTLRRRATVAAFGIAAIIGLAQATWGFRPDGQPTVRPLQPTVTDVAIVVLLYTLAAYRPWRQSLAGLVLCLAGSGIAIDGWAFTYRGVTFLLLAMAGLGSTFVAAWVLGDSAAYRRAYYASLEERLASAERARDLEEKRALAVEESAARLRRVERDLHDGAQVRLTALAMALGEIKEALASRGDPVQILALASEAHQAAKDTLGELRDLVRGIHPPVLDRGLDVALRSLAESSPIPVSVDIAIGGRLSPGTEAVVYFSVAELVANAAKHSGASGVTVTVRPAGTDMLITVMDDGAGGACVTGGGGLAGLHDRVRTVDGRIGIDSPAGGPTIISIQLPGLA
jgi:signal transduction histidine kinase